MRDKPAEIGERELASALASGWRIDPAAMSYAPVGGGSYHWVVRDGGGRWFVTADDLDDKDWIGTTRTAVFDGLAAAMETAVALRDDAGLRFVVAPVRAHDGATVRPLGQRYALTVFPFVPGTSGRFDQNRSARERAEVLDVLAALHGTRSLPAPPPRPAIGWPLRSALDTALAELGQPWTGGPFAEPARALLARSARPVRDLLAEFDQLAVEVAAAAPELVITHGEPHPGNLIKAGRVTMLIDWDTVGLAPPERDLWLVASPGGDELRRYAAATGHSANPAALALYQIRWALYDASAFVHRLRGRHRRTADGEHAWRSLNITIAKITQLAAAGPRPERSGRPGRSPLT